MKTKSIIALALAFSSFGCASRAVVNDVIILEDDHLVGEVAYTEDGITISEDDHLADEVAYTEDEIIILEDDHLVDEVIVLEE